MHVVGDPNTARDAVFDLAGQERGSVRVRAEPASEVLGVVRVDEPRLQHATRLSAAHMPAGHIRVQGVAACAKVAAVVPWVAVAVAATPARSAAVMTAASTSDRVCLTPTCRAYPVDRLITNMAVTS
jgi:hypothetical protein